MTPPTLEICSCVQSGRLLLRESSSSRSFSCDSGPPLVYRGETGPRPLLVCQSHASLPLPACAVQPRSYHLCQPLSAARGCASWRPATGLRAIQPSSWGCCRGGKLGPTLGRRRWGPPPYPCGYRERRASAEWPTPACLSSPRSTGGRAHPGCLPGKGKHWLLTSHHQEAPCWPQACASRLSTVACTGQEDVEMWSTALNSAEDLNLKEAELEPSVDDEIKAEAVFRKRSSVVAMSSDIATTHCLRHRAVGSPRLASREQGWSAHSAKRDVKGFSLGGRRRLEAFSRDSWMASSSLFRSSKLQLSRGSMGAEGASTSTSLLLSMSAVMRCLSATDALKPSIRESEPEGLDAAWQGVKSGLELWRSDWTLGQSAPRKS